MAGTNITIFGVGALATLFGCFLSRKPSAARVTLVGNWQDQIEAMRKSPVTLTGIDGTEGSCRLHATGNLDEVAATDIALILVKGYQTARVAKQAAAVLRAGGIAVTLQNGIGNGEVLRESLGESRVVLGTTIQGAYLAAPGKVIHGGEGATCLESGGEGARWVALLADILRESGIETRLVPDVQNVLWQKLLVNAAINPIAALLELRNGELLDNPVIVELMARVAREVVAVAEKHGIDPEVDAPAAHIHDICRATGKNFSSMLQDIRRGAPTEIDTITGAIVRLGRAYGIPTPVNGFLYEHVKAKESGVIFDPVDIRRLLGDEG